ncbi:MAG TPA: DedA family protein [Candidatus Caenarcaniphilales bacterium]
MSLEFLSLETLQQLAHQYGYWAVLLGILLENTGIPLPGETITLVGGFLAGSGELDYWLVLGSAVSGAILGGSFGYWVGYSGGWPLLLRLGSFFRIQEVHLLEVKTRFSDNAARAVFLGRFVAFLRVFAGPMAGIVGMPFGQFMLYNTLGATLWASVIVTLSFFLGRVAPLEQVVAWVSQFALVALGMVVAWATLPPWLARRKQVYAQLKNQEAE